MKKMFEKIKAFFGKKKKEEPYGNITENGEFEFRKGDDCCGMGSCSPAGIDSGLMAEAQELDKSIAEYRIQFGIKKPKKIKKPNPKKRKKRK